MGVMTGKAIRRKPAKRSKDQRRLDRKRVSELILQSYTHQEIADILFEETGTRLARRTIGADVAIVRKDWLEQRRDNYEMLINQELARADATEGEIWRAWRASCDESERKVVEEIAKKVGDDRELMVAKITTVTESGGVGDPRLMDKIIAVQKERRRLLGLYAPAKLGIDIRQKSEVTIKGYAARDVSPDAWPDIVEGEVVDLTDLKRIGDGDDINV